MDERQNNPTTQNEMITAPQKPMKDETDRPVGFWPFVGLIVLFSIPVIGWIAALIFLLVAKNKNIKNFSGAHFAVTTVQCIASVLVSILLFSAVFGMLLPVINRALGTDFDDISQLISITDLPDGKYSKALARFVPTINAATGGTYEAFLKELSSGKYEKLLRQIAEEEYAAVLNDFENGVYPELTSKLDPDTYQLLLDELRKEVDGTGSVLIDQLEDLLP